VLTEVERGDLSVQTSLAPDTRRSIRRLEQSINRFMWMVVAVGLLIAGTNLYVASEGTTLGLSFMGAALFVFLWGAFKRR
jgi:hypothetical protein